MNTVRLGLGPDITVYNFGYEMIRRLVLEYQICCVCRKGYTQDNPQVALNTCLTCFLIQHPEIDKYIGTTPLNEDKDMYLFLDKQGYVHYSYRDSDQLVRDVYETLKYWQFPIPTEYTRGDLTIQMSQNYWSIVSEFVTKADDGSLEPKPIIIIEYTHRAGDNRKITYISYRNDTATLIDNRSKWIRSLFTDAKNHIESTMRDPEGGYLVHGHRTLALTPYHLYEVVADILCERYNKSMQEGQV